MTFAQSVRGSTVASSTFLSTRSRLRCVRSNPFSIVSRLSTCAQGEVYVKFSDMNGSTAALTGLNGRFLCVFSSKSALARLTEEHSGGRTITANYISDAIFRASTGQR